MANVNSTNPSTPTHSELFDLNDQFSLAALKAGSLLTLLIHTDDLPSSDVMQANMLILTDYMDIMKAGAQTAFNAALFPADGKGTVGGLPGGHRESDEAP
jgi:hypothetical protein